MKIALKVAITWPPIYSGNQCARHSMNSGVRTHDSNFFSGVNRTQGIQCACHKFKFEDGTDLSRGWRGYKWIGVHFHQKKSIYEAKMHREKIVIYNSNGDVMEVWPLTSGSCV